MSYSQAIIIGFLGADPELKYTKNQKPVVTFPVGVKETLDPNTPKEAQAKTHWHKCRRWGNLAENFKTRLKKGDKVFIKGQLIYDHWEDKSGKQHKVAVIEIHHLEKMYFENVTIDMNSF